MREKPDKTVAIIATLDTSYLDQPAARTIDLFPSRIVGQIGKESIARCLTGFNSRFLDRLSPGREYLLVTGEQVHNLLMVQSEDLIDA